MVWLASGYVMKTKLAMDMAKELGIDEARNNVLNARVFLNRYIRSQYPNFPMIRGFEYAPFKPDDTFAYILVTRLADDNPKRTFEERPVDRKIKDAFVKIVGLQDSDVHMHWATVRCQW
ncbi:hypothetical protein HGRIS_011105 [Hohenbuehelia grisea]|uniref:Uncharacterized protein n=1 Tax=Hohenbuehelia grisea TaxID=104357 RepID=A0ABR3IYU9_9AGAR